MNTYMPNAESVESKWYVVDAKDLVLGRVASEVAKILSGKNKPIYTPHVDTGDHVIVLNVEKVVLTGKKLDQKLYRYHTGHPGGLKETKYRDMMINKPEEVFMHAVKGMLPKNKIGRKMLKKLRVYKGTEHNHEAQLPEVLEIKF
ncbi:MAG: 50S ribosomal protein L13 [Firmicutes bacterium HGW-Firmicutes-1]|jgi:large subunit ribosomal protein L13|nr:MAG: 50S ribosomal protein L13 [Firmicutes bacterium HGW-Firmicutes-1]